MFGILKPHLQLLARRDRSRYGSAYCNLCGLLGSRYGLKSRMLVVNDIATLWWLLEDTSAVGYRPLVVGNCIRGGTRSFSRKQLPPLARFLASISAYTIGVKVTDDIQDGDRWRAPAVGRIYRKAFSEARQDLLDIGFDVVELETVLEEHGAVERRCERDLTKAADATGRAYSMVAQAMIGHLRSRFTLEQSAIVGDAIGRAIYVVDAIRDYTQDCGIAFNPLCKGVETRGSQLAPSLKHEAVSYVAEHLRRGRDEVSRVGGQIKFGWHSIERSLLAAVGVNTPKSVTLYMGCCVPCGDGAVFIDGNDCDGCGWTCVGVCLLACCCCSNGCPCGG